MRRSLGMLVLLSLGAPVAAQGGPRLGTATLAGRVSYVATYSLEPARAVLGLSARRHLTGGGWDSFTLDLARGLWASPGGRMRLRTTARCGLIDARTTWGTELAWQRTGRVRFTGGLWLVLGGSSSPAVDAWTAGANVRLTSDAGLLVLGKHVPGSHGYRVDFLVWTAR